MLRAALQQRGGQRCNNEAQGTAQSPARLRRAVVEPARGAHELSIRVGRALESRRAAQARQLSFAQIAKEISTERKIEKPSAANHRDILISSRVSARSTQESRWRS